MNPEAPVYGWVEIAKVLDRSREYAMQRAKRNVDPLPVFWDDDRVAAYPSALNAWRARQMRWHTTKLEMDRLKTIETDAAIANASIKRRKKAS